MRLLSLFLALAAVLLITALPVLWNLRAARASTNGAAAASPRAWSRAWKARLRNPHLSADEFTRLFAEALRSRVRGAEARVSAPLTVEIQLPGGKTTTAYLDNAWGECRDDPSVRIEWYKRLLGALPEVTSPEDARPAHIVPLIRDDEFIAEATQKSSVKAERLVADLWIVYAEDRPRTLSYLPGDTPADLQGLRQRATQYLRSVLPKVERHGPGPCYMLTAGGDFESSLLLLNEIWNEQARQVDGELVAAVPSRDVVLFTGSHSETGLAELRTAVHDIHSTGSYPVSEMLLVWRHGEWEKYAPSGA